MVRIIAIVPFLVLASAVTPEELESFLYSPSGLDMSRSDAHSLAEKEATILTQCQVTISDLKQLQSVLYSPSLLDFSKTELQGQLLLLAEQHVNPDEVKSMYQLLYDTRSLDLSKNSAKTSTLPLVKRFAEQSQIKDLYGVLSGIKSKAEAQSLTVSLASAGCDPVALKNSYATSRNLNDATKSALRANLNGEARRYAKNGVAYHFADFEQYYGERSMTEWLAAPQEKRVANDGKAYAVSQFRTFYSSSWEQQWQRAGEATQLRIAPDGKVYGVADFVQYYKDDWQARWEEAPEVACKECRSQELVV